MNVSAVEIPFLNFTTRCSHPVRKFDSTNFCMLDFYVSFLVSSKHLGLCRSLVDWWCRLNYRVDRFIVSYSFVTHHTCSALLHTSEAAELLLPQTDSTSLPQRTLEEIIPTVLYKAVFKTLHAVTGEHTCQA